jgi:hypothetical protein
MDVHPIALGTSAAGLAKRHNILYVLETFHSVEEVNRATPHPRLKCDHSTL